VLTFDPMTRGLMALVLMKTKRFILLTFRCITEWLRLASQRRRNFIVDQVSEVSFDELSACMNGHGANHVELYRVKLFALIVNSILALCVALKWCSQQEQSKFTQKSFYRIASWGLFRKTYNGRNYFRTVVI
jgi:hypothetical protein